MVRKREEGELGTRHCIKYTPTHNRTSALLLFMRCNPNNALPMACASKLNVDVSSFSASVATSVRTSRWSLDSCWRPYNALPTACATSTGWDSLTLVARAFTSRSTSG